MKLLRLKLNTKFRSLQPGFEVHFLRNFDKKKMWDFMPYCLVGRNGSGKSNILEALAAIFYHIECIYLDYKPEGFEGEGEFRKGRDDGFFAEQCTPDAFELEYIYYVKGDFSREFSSDFDIGYEAHISIVKREGHPPKVLWLNREEIEKNDDLELTRTEVKKMLPDFVVGYSSGENEILSLPFFKMRFINYEEYEDSLRNETGYNQPEGRLVYIDTQYSQAVFLTNYLMQKDDFLNPIFRTIGIKAIRQFRIIIRQGVPIAKFRSEELSPDENLKLEIDNKDVFDLTYNLFQRKDSTLKDIKTIDKLKNCATAQFYDIENKTLYLDYFVDKEGVMKEAFRGNFENAFELFRSFQILLTLNLHSVDRNLRKDLYKSGSLYVNETVPILASDKRIMRFKDFSIEKENTREDILSKSLSDGEHQYLHAIGICLLFKDTNSLFLLDEPETHFNPDWRARFISTLRDCLKDTDGNSYLRELLITSHSPFIVSDSHEENVLVFTKDPETGMVKANRPGFNTFGSSVNQITIKVFGKYETIGNYAKEILDELYKRLEASENRDTLIEEAFDKLGDSVERIIFINKALEK